jgi:hypothetical protein
LAKAKAVGKSAAKICKEHDMNIGTVPDERYGKVNTYPTEVLEELIAA